MNLLVKSADFYIKVAMMFTTLVSLIYLSVALRRPELFWIGILFLVSIMIIGIGYTIEAKKIRDQLKKIKEKR